MIELIHEYRNGNYKDNQGEFILLLSEKYKKFFYKGIINTINELSRTKSLTPTMYLFVDAIIDSLLTPKKPNVVNIGLLINYSNTNTLSKNYTYPIKTIDTEISIFISKYGVKGFVDILAIFIEMLNILKDKEQLVR